MTDERLRIERLKGLCRVWGAAKFFHPYLAYRDIDWDAALVAAIPKVSSATSTEEYAAGVNELLSALGDPGTRVIDKSSLDAMNDDLAEPSEGEPKLLWRDDAAVLRASQLASMPFPELSAKMKSWLEEMESADKVVFDLRRSGGYALTNALMSAAPYLLDGTALHPSRRSRMHSGYPSDGGGASFYSAGFYVQDALPLVGTGGPLAAKPLAVIADETSGIPDWAMALQGVGRARVVFAGDPEVVAAQDWEVIRLAEDINVLLRVSEMVMPDGSGGFTPDRVVENSDDGSDPVASPVVAAALEALSAPPVPKSRPEATVTTYRREKRYQETPYPDLEHRLLALFRYWTIMDLFFPYKAHLDEPWDDVLAEGIPLLEAAADETEYVLALATVIAKTRDTHCFVYSEAFQRWMGPTHPWMKVRFVEGRSVVTHVDASIEGVAIGDLLLSVDGETAESRRDRLRPYIAASTPQAMEWRLHNALLGGEADSDAVLELERADGTVATATVRRDQAYVPPPERPLPVFGVLPSGFGYFDLARLMVDQVDDAFEAVRETPALIIDDRCYPNGTAWAIAPRLADGPVAGALFRRPEPRSPDRDFVHEHRFIQTLPASDKWRYKNPVVMLIDGEAISQAEHTCLLIDAACKPTFIGSATNGANGDVTSIQLPGGVRTMFSGHDVRHADGRQLQRVGIQPDIEVHPTIAGIREGRDEALEAAIAHLTKKARSG